MSPTRPRASRSRSSEQPASAVPVLSRRDTGESQERDLAQTQAPAAVALTQFLWGSALHTTLNSLALLEQVHSAQVQMLKDLGHVLQTAQDDVRQASAMEHLMSMPAGRAVSQLGSTLNSWTESWRAQWQEGTSRWTEPPVALPTPLVLLNNALVTGSRMLEAWVTAARNTNHAIIVMA